ncbi:MAG: 3-oxoacyl-ACP reductase FabG [Egibacteraceae bacterium]
MLEEKKVLITGGSRGIGAGVVRAAMREGAEVAFTFHKSCETAQELSHRMATRHPERRCLALQCDVTDSNGMQEVVKAVTRELGRIDVLVNNAGVRRDAQLARMSREHWDEVISTNLGGMYNATKPLVLQLVKQRTGSIINLTSIAGMYGNGGQANYAASKAGVIGFTKALSKEVAAFGVRVNAVAPGFIETDMISGMDEGRLKFIKSLIPAGRLGTVEDVAALICFLASDKASYLTGQVIEVAGGLTS